MCIYTHVHPIIAVPSPRSPTTIATIIVSVVVMRTIFGVTVITIDIIGSTFGSESWVCFSEGGARFFQPRAFLPQNGVSLSCKGACFFQNRTCFSERAMTMTVPTTTMTMTTTTTTTTTTTNTTTTTTSSLSSWASSSSSKSPSPSYQPALSSVWVPPSPPPSSSSVAMLA